MVFKNNSLSEGYFYRVDKNLNTGKSARRKLTKQTRGNFTVNIPPILVDMMKTTNIDIDYEINKDGSLKYITISPVYESEKNKQVS